MDKSYAGYLAIHNLHKHGLLRHGWGFRWHNKKVALGTCSYNRKKIYLSEWYVELNDQEEVMDTILHEIAHALAYHRHGSAGRGHGEIWKSICREIGASPKRLNKGELDRPKNHYKYVDKCCGVEYKRHRVRKNSKYYCPKCNVTLFRGEKEKSADRSAKKLLESILGS